MMYANYVILYTGDLLFIQNPEIIIANGAWSIILHALLTKRYGYANKIATYSHYLPFVEKICRFVENSYDSLFQSLSFASTIKHNVNS